MTHRAESRGVLVYLRTRHLSHAFVPSFPLRDFCTEKKHYPFVSFCLACLRVMLYTLAQHYGLRERGPHRLSPPRLGPRLGAIRDPPSSLNSRVLRAPHIAIPCGVEARAETAVFSVHTANS